MSFINGALKNKYNETKPEMLCDISNTKVATFVGVDKNTKDFRQHQQITFILRQFGRRNSPGTDAEGP